MKPIISFFLLSLTVLAGCSSKRRQISQNENTKLETSTTDSSLTQVNRSQLARSVFTKAWIVDSPAITLIMTDGTIIHARATRACNNVASHTITRGRDSISINTIKRDSMVFTANSHMSETNQRQSGNTTVPLITLLVSATLIFVSLRKIKRL